MTHPDTHGPTTGKGLTVFRDEVSNRIGTNTSDPSGRRHDRSGVQPLAPRERIQSAEAGLHSTLSRLLRGVARRVVEATRPIGWPNSRRKFPAACSRVISIRSSNSSGFYRLPIAPSTHIGVALRLQVWRPGQEAHQEAQASLPRRCCHKA